MTAARRNPAEVAAAELELDEPRRRRLATAIMLVLEVACAIAGVAAFLSIAAGELGWAALLALCSSSSYLAADRAGRP